MSAKSFTYAIVGVTSTDTLVFKTLVRLLQRDLTHIWNYVAVGHSVHWDSVKLTPVELYITTPEISQAWQTQYSNVRHPFITLVFGEQKSETSLDKSVFYISRPLTADNLTKTLETLGAKLLEIAQSSIQSALETPIEPILRFKTKEHFGAAGDDSVLKNASPSAPIADAHCSETLDTRLYQLTRWPSSKDLTTAAHVRMATALSGRALSMQELTIVARQEASECEVFLKTLTRLGLLYVTQPATSPSGAGSAQAAIDHAPSSDKKRGLLSLIRQRLGL